MKHRRAAARLVLAAGVLAIDWAAAPGASATSIVGLGNATFDNVCANHGSATAYGVGTGGGGFPNRRAYLPATTPANHCGGGPGLPLASDPCLPEILHFPSSKGEAFAVCKAVGQNPLV
ncbi:hypothetical protein [Streptomyces natalensis]|uniref:Chaplin domain-containing protein n=1 Tax=Streptomyces natalensis ATCC 27448 TaxID=1240678 RepID=A0A0D7CN31_9ACTN|nr:hypothetical protein [Streptomyces natalensis]KIZ17613.1 hypothetical protein SNA_14145 [Streptomyces natalensis ATCC 27448]